MRKKLFTLLLAIVAGIGTLFAESGTCGENLTWDLTNGVLTISGTGDMNNYTDSPLNPAPWILKPINAVVIEYGVASIGNYAFYACNEMESITISNSVKSIGKGTFQGCSALDVIEIPDSVIYIGESVFQGCNTLTSIDVDSDNPYYTSINGVLLSKTELIRYPIGKKSKSYTIPNSITSIEQGAFQGCIALETIEIPNSITSIKQGAFQGCIALVTIKIPNSITTIGQGVFQGCIALETIEIPNSITSIGNSAFNGCSSLTSVTMPNSVTSLGNYAFCNCKGLTSVEIPNSITSIGESAFAGCNKMKSITIPRNVADIQGRAFYDCTDLISVTIPDNLSSIEWGTFENCKSLTCITIPSNVTSIGAGAFNGCSSLANIYMEAPIPPSIYNNTFYNIPSNAKVHVPLGASENYKTVDIWKNMTIVGPEIQHTEKSAATSVSLQFEVEDAELQSCGIEGGEQQAGNVLEYIGLEPNSEYKDVPIVLTSKEGLTETINVSFKTTALELTTKESKAVSSSTALLFAETNMSDVETNCGFEWKRENAPESMAGTKVYCPVASGQMAGRLKNLKDDVYYKYRAFYLSTAGNMYYGDWQYIFTGDVTVEFDPVLYTYTASAITETSAIISGYALAGSEDFTEQGFEYWSESRVEGQSNQVQGTKAPLLKQAILGEHIFVQTSGINMRVSLTNLDAGTIYKYRAYAKVGDQIYYGSEQSFTTSGTYTPPTYVITFVNWDGTELQSSPVVENTLPEYTGEQPTRPNDEEFSYSFKGWTPEIVIATEDATYTATFEKTTLTAISNIETGTSALKVLRNGHIFILRGEKVYNAQGALVK